MIPRPKEISPEEWEYMLSPKQYTNNGQLDSKEAEFFFKNRVRDLVSMRRRARAEHHKRVITRTPMASFEKKEQCRYDIGGKRCKRMVILPASYKYPLCWQHAGSHR